jgi:hypothetical protein
MQFFEEVLNKATGVDEKLGRRGEPALDCIFTVVGQAAEA